MIDYKGLEALHTVIKFNSFEKAAKQLHLTQSAISQRIKNLENEYGHPLLSRSSPYGPTKLGSLLISHFLQVQTLRASLRHTIDKSSEKPTCMIALNRDSLETWFLPFLQEQNLAKDYILEIHAADQEKTIEFLKKGMASIAISSSSKKISGIKSTFLGTMEYLLVASPNYLKQLFSPKNPREFFKKATALRFDSHDHLQEKYLETYFFKETNDLEISYHYLPSVQGFKQLTLNGNCYALLPKMDISNEIQKKQLVEIFPTKTWKIPLYLHYWDNYNSPFHKIHNLIVDYTKNNIH